jgi:Cu-Zn family superoxide dismutase
MQKQSLTTRARSEDRTLRHVPCRMKPVGSDVHEQKRSPSEKLSMRIALITGLWGLSLTACNGNDDTALEDTASRDAQATGAASPGSDTGAAAGASARATIRDSSGRELGTVTLTDTVGGIAVAGTLQGLPPGTRAIHLHMTGLCEPPFESAGDHWNPTNRQHGTENPQGPHFGDLPNVTISTDSAVSVQMITPGGALRGTNALLDTDGAAVVLHAQPDDNRTDPSGNAGDRIACGAVTVS